MYHFISTSRVKITKNIYENQINITQYKSVLDVIANDKTFYLKKLNKLAFQPWGPQLAQHHFSYLINFPNRCAQKLLDQYFSVLIKQERNTAKQKEGLKPRIKHDICKPSVGLAESIFLNKLDYTD